jgi:N-acyl-D-amino-acid deacylase
MKTIFLVSLLAFFASCQSKQEYDLIIRNATIYNGSGEKPFAGDVAIQADTIAEIATVINAKGKKEIEAKGLALAPGFINMLSWADGSLLKDGRSMSDIKQGVTLEVFGEGWSPGPRIKKDEKDSLWSTLGEYFETAERKGGKYKLRILCWRNNCSQLCSGL